MTDSKTTIDWLRFRTQAEPRDGLEALRGLFGAHGELLNLKPLDRAKDGFQQACAVRMGDMALGRVDFGGKSQRGWVRWNITGQGCEWVEDWDALADVEALPATEIRRADIALTTWRGEVSHERVKAAHAAGRFNCGGRPPELRTIESSDDRAGETCYVGNRKGDKFFRGYEKGLEMAARYGQAGVNMTHIQGVDEDGAAMMFRVEDIYRCEVEFKAEGSVVPWEAIERRDEYFVGSYPFLAELVPGVESDILMRRPERAPQTELAAVLANIRVQYGASLFTGLVAYHGDIGRVWEQICGKEHNARLLAAGVLLVDHD
jgi:DNA relaxase NicK